MTGFYRAAWGFYLVLALAGLAGLAAQGTRIELTLFVDPGGVGLDLALGVGAGALLLLLWRLAVWRSAAARRLEARLGELLGPIRRDELVALALISALAEEVAFRGALQGAIGYLPAALLFALLHVGPGAEFRLWTLFALAGGLVFGLLALERGALAAAIVAHLVVNLVQLDRIARRAAPVREE